MSKIIQTFLLLMGMLFACFCMANELSHTDKPWSTGVLINNGAIKVEKGELTSFNDFYNTQVPGIQQWGVYSQNVYGISDYWSIQLIPAYNYNVFGEGTSTGWGDLQMLLAYQFHRQMAGSDWPSIKINLNATFPTGRYSNLDINNDGFDATGMGTYLVGAIINTEYLTMPIPDRFLDIYCSLGYSYWIPTHVDGRNVYGGGIGTSGKLSSSDEIFSDLAFEFHVTNHWALIFEMYYLYVAPASFNGTLGQDLEGAEAAVLREGTNQFSLAPAIAYNFSANLGILAGVWFSLNDNQTNEFRSIQVALSLSFPDL